MKTILILGASYAGLTVAHKLLKHTLRGLKDEYKVIIVSPSTHHYWNVASVRAIIPDQIPDGKLFQSVLKGLKQYDSSVQFIQGSAANLNPTSKTVTLKTSQGEVSQIYDILIIATASRTEADVPWKSSLSVRDAKSIVIGGAGPTGVETAAELGFEFRGRKEITLITSGKTVLPGVPKSVTCSAETSLKKLSIKTITETKITSTQKLSTGQTELILSSGSKLTVDLYLPTIGVIPNTEFIPKEFLNERGDVRVDEFLRVRGMEGVWAAGDVVDCQPKQFVYCEKQAAALAKNLDLVVKGKQPVVYNSGGPPILGVSLGRKRATGRFGNFKAPSLAIWLVKGRTLQVEKLPGYVTGSAF